MEANVIVGSQLLMKSYQVLSVLSSICDRQFVRLSSRNSLVRRVLSGKNVTESCTQMQKKGLVKCGNRGTENGNRSVVLLVSFGRPRYTLVYANNEIVMMTESKQHSEISTYLVGSRVRRSEAACFPRRKSQWTLSPGLFND